MSSLFMEWFIENKAKDKHSVAAKKTYGTSRMDAYTIFENLLNLRMITIRDRIDDGDGKNHYELNKNETMLARERANQIQEAFKSWIWEDAKRRQKYVEYYNETFNNVRLREYDGSHLEFPGMNPDIEEEKQHEDTKKKDSANKTKKDTPYTEETVIGIIEIPSIDLKYPIFEGDGEAELSNGIGHLPESAGLLEQGNCILAGHNGSRRGTFFTNLNTIPEKAEVIITNNEERTKTYEVVETKIVDPYNSAVRENTPDETLTLFICAYHGTQRFVCICK